mmetsp:Transcript_53585/g.138534  ORF Transcript_53585/g.138534 Transcript_53585/m.138534 type:complete len:80 (+) Transcript_53585:76-315(+)
MDYLFGDKLFVLIEEGFTKPCVEKLPQIAHGFCAFGPSFIVFPLLVGTVAILAFFERRQKAREALKTTDTTTPAQKKKD